jgi:hypothetical protein
MVEAIIGYMYGLAVIISSNKLARQGDCDDE